MNLKTNPINKILIANRGEIAVRIIRTAKKLGINTVAVFSEADRDAPHVRMADEAVYLGPAPSVASYLSAEKIITKALELEVDAIHPGYGFLSENAAFAEAVEQAGLTFIGPGAEAIRTMGSKLAAKEAVKTYNIPLVPGTESAVKDLGQARKVAKEIGYPVLIKASAGGGGKGMRIVHKPEDLESQMERAVSEAKSAFGDGAVFIEKYIGSPRHIEVQVLADHHGNVVHMFERECSIQRRHQKVVEEAPSVAVDSALRESLGDAAIKVARACNYLGAGTVEFLLGENGSFYFLEMNTRLQVEHPVTEMITGKDLVELQIDIARGNPIPFQQKDLKITGHAIELRIYAEDPMNDFLPSVGILEVYRMPHGGGIRVDNGYEEGMAVPIYYDPMLAKLIVYGETRAKALVLLREAIARFQVKGVATTLMFGEFVADHPAFIKGDFDTHFVKNYFNVEALVERDIALGEVAAIFALHVYLEDRKKLRLPN